MSRTKIEPTAAQTRGSRRGVALVVTVILIAFVTIVLVAVTSLLRVDSYVALNSRQSAMARQHALLGLHRALADLQRAAGPDQRVTSNAELLVSTRVENRNWTAAWSGGIPTWLVSGSGTPATYDPQTSVVGGRVRTGRPDGVVLVGEATVDVSVDVDSNGQPDDVVVIDKVPVETEERRLPGFDANSTNRCTIGHYAFWIGDEGVKASITETEDWAEVGFDEYQDDGFDDPERLRLAQLSLPRQRIEPFFKYLNSPIVPTAPGTKVRLRKIITPYQVALLPELPGPSQIRERFHDFTVFSHGVLANVAAGRLREDLSASSLAAGGKKSFLEARPNGSTPSTATAAFYRIHPPVTTSAGQPFFAVIPVLSEFEVNVRFSSTGEPIFWNATIELWNPFNAGLDLEEMSVVVPASNFSGLATPVAGENAYVISIFPSAFPSATLQPGEVVSLSLDQSTGSLLFEDRPLSAEVRLLRESDSAILAHFAMTSPNVVSDGPGPVVGRFSSSFRLLEPSDDPDWLSHYDPRGPQISSIALLPRSPAATLPLLQAGMRAVLFDIARQEQVSVGSLQHLGFTRPPGGSLLQGAFLLGQVAGGSINGVFDDAFFSTVPRDASATWEPWTGPLPNSRIEVYNPDPAAPADADQLRHLAAISSRAPASRLLVRGAFNINSTSAVAWRALLRGTDIPSWNFEGSGSLRSLDNAFFRLPQLAQYIGEDFNSNSWRQGIRELDSAHADAIADYIAEHIGDALGALKGAGQPFRSLSDFVNSGILENAIRDAPDPANPGVLNNNIPRYSPGYLSQAEFLNSWAPFLQARSDTFLIRAYGEIVNPVLDPDGSDPLVGPVTGRAWCEAVVQRVPDYVNAGGENQKAWEDPAGTNIVFGRRFKIVQFRWLSPADI